MRANDTTRRSAGVAGRVLDSEIGMMFVRRRMSWLLSIWLVCQVTALAAPVVLASTNDAVLTIVPLELLSEHAVDVPDDPGSLQA